MIRNWLAPLLYVVTVWICIAPETGDTLNYCNDILAARTGIWSTSFHPLWEFGHLLWRPIGALLAPILLKMVPDPQAWTPVLKIAWGLTALNYIAGFMVVVVLYRIMIRFTKSWIAAVFLALVLTWANGFLIYTQSGSAYIVGLLFEVLALRIQLRDTLTESWKQDVLAAVLIAIAVLLWFPYILMFPGVAASRWLVNRLALREGLRQFLRIGVLGALIIAAAMTAGAWLAGVRSGGEFLAWYRSAQHGLSQNNQLIRAVSGVPRLLLDLTGNGVTLKRFVLHDPYNPVSGLEFALSLWKVLLFYAVTFTGLLLVWLWAPARRWLLLLGLAWVPLLAFSVFLFEPSGPERFLPALPFLILSWASVWPASGHWAKYGRVTLVVLALVGILANAQRFALGSGKDMSSSLARLQELNEETNPGDVMITVTFADPFVNVIEQRPFHSYNRTRKFRTYQLMEIPTEHAIHWRAAFAKRVLGEWSAHRVWLSKNVRDDTPPSRIQWTEGDDPLLKWRDVPALFTKLEYDAETGHQDGFIRLSRSRHNREELERLIEADPAAQ
jgi:hypothetical protein